MAGSSIPVLWTNDDVHPGKAGQLKRQLDFLGRHEIPGVFFVIPRDDLDQDVELLRLIENARGRGHEFFQHGWMHWAFECGVPELGMLEVDRKSFARYDEEREEIEAGHTLERLVEMLENGQRVWRRAFGENSPGFRPGWGAYCTNLYRALRILGYQWVSSRIPCMTSWGFASGHWDAKLHFRDAIPTRPYPVREGLWEFPIAGDYAFKVPNTPEKIARMIQLGHDEFEEYSRRGDPMLIVSHFHGLAYSGVKEDATEVHPSGTGYAVHDELLPALRKTGRARFMNMSELISETPEIQKP